MTDNSKLIERLRASDLLPADMEFLVDEAADALEAADKRIAELETREENLVLHNDELASHGLRLGQENERLRAVVDAFDEAVCMLDNVIINCRTELDKDND